MATEKQIEKARKSFDYACKQASMCRHEQFQQSCCACPKQKDCEIQERVTKNHEILRSDRKVEPPLTF